MEGDRNDYVSNGTMGMRLSDVRKVAVQQAFEPMQLPLLRLLYQTCGSDWMQLVRVVADVVTRSDAEDAEAVRAILFSTASLDALEIEDNPFEEEPTPLDMQAKSKVKNRRVKDKLLTTLEKIRRNRGAGSLDQYRERISRADEE